MKKYLFPIITSLTIGLVMSILLINSYDGEKALTISNGIKPLYYIQKGTYSNKQSMQENMSDFEHYIYNKEEGKYYTYIGITQNKQNALKIKKYYENQGYKTHIKEKNVGNRNFIKIIKQYDKILAQTTDEKTINTICNQILSKYEELLNNEY